MGTGKRLADKLEPMEHSKLPWRIEKDLGEWMYSATEGEAIMEILSQDRANAQFIVEACNNYYAMRAALEVIADNSIEQFVVTTARNALDSLMLNPAPGDTE